MCIFLQSLLAFSISVVLLIFAAALIKVIFVDSKLNRSHITILSVTQITGYLKYSINLVTHTVLKYVTANRYP
jgi:hypothetical protein